MKNMILGMVGSFFIIYVLAISLSTYNISVRKNELDNCVSSVLAHTISRYYGVENYDIEAATEIEKEIQQRLGTEKLIEVSFKACDLKRGIISVIINEKFAIPGGSVKEISCKRTIIVDREKEEETNGLN